MTLKPEVLCHIVDVHCHPTDAPSISIGAMQSLDITICAMSSMKSDQQLVAELAMSYPEKVIPCFGYHPWFSYTIAMGAPVSKDEHYRNLFLGVKGHGTEENLEAFNKLIELLPDPTPLQSILDEVRDNLTKFPDAMVGEIGLDRVFRVPFDYFAEHRELSPRGGRPCNSDFQPPTSCTAKDTTTSPESIRKLKLRQVVE
ncbi:hypothetical protein FA15DRAFT_663031 [Coprinopsis marcescibilis]|uniref:Metallo-dependent hydrolase n=1 Tax=Coprinopsis marcescibilis TaxID=230819 RepID=A0A5C3LQE2_COPMA|nr:hypothetical protein FA15DRAFT_663031 [Coprinopsis marcescibilis]